MDMLARSKEPCNSASGRSSKATTSSKILAQKFRERCNPNSYRCIKSPAKVAANGSKEVKSGQNKENEITVD